MSYFISPYRFANGDSGDQLGWAVFLSAAFHLLAAGLIIYVLPALLINKAGPEDRGLDKVIRVHIPGDLRTNAYDETLIDPRLARRDEGQVTKNTDRTKSQQSQDRTEPRVTFENYVTPIDNKNPLKVTEEIARTTALPGISTPDVNPEPASAIKHGQAVGGGGGRGGSEGLQELHPEIAGYYGLIRSIISRNWTTPAETFSRDITAIYAVTIEPDGLMSEAELLTPSGNELYDLSVLRAIDRSVHLPKLPPIFQGRTIRVGLVFNLSDLLRARPRQQTSAPGRLSADGLSYPGPGSN